MGTLITIILLASIFSLVIFKLVNYKHDSSPTPPSEGGGGGNWENEEDTSDPSPNEGGPQELEEIKE